MAGAPKKLSKPSDLLKDPSIWVILGANLFPVYAVSVWHWDLFTLILLYWCEAFVLVMIQGLKICIYYPSQIKNALTMLIIFNGGFLSGQMVAIYQMYAPRGLNFHGVLDLISTMNFLTLLLVFTVQNTLEIFLNPHRPMPPPELALEITNQNPIAPPPTPTPAKVDPSQYHAMNDWQSELAAPPPPPLTETTMPVPSARQRWEDQQMAQANSLYLRPIGNIFFLQFIAIIGGMLYQGSGSKIPSLMLVIFLKMSGGILGYLIARYGTTTTTVISNGKSVVVDENLPH